MKWEKAHTYLHVVKWDEPGAVREVRLAQLPDAGAFYAPCWIEENNSRQLLACAELFPLRMRAEVVAHQTRIAEAKAVLRKAEGEIYRLLNAR